MYELYLKEDGIKRCVGTFKKEVDVKAQLLYWSLLIDEDSELSIRRVK